MVGMNKRRSAAANSGWTICMFLHLCIWHEWFAIKLVYQNIITLLLLYSNKGHECSNKRRECTHTHTHTHTQTHTLQGERYQAATEQFVTETDLKKKMTVLNRWVCKLWAVRDIVHCTPAGMCFVVCTVCVCLCVCAGTVCCCAGTVCTVLALCAAVQKTGLCINNPHSRTHVDTHISTHT